MTQTKQKWTPPKIIECQPDATIQCDNADEQFWSQLSPSQKLQTIHLGTNWHHESDHDQRIRQIPPGDYTNEYWIIQTKIIKIITQKDTSESPKRRCDHEI